MPDPDGSSSSCTDDRSADCDDGAIGLDQATRLYSLTTGFD